MNKFISIAFSLILFNCNLVSQETKPKLISVAKSNIRWTAIAVSEKERIFVNFPRWSPIPYSVCEIVNGEFVPFPNTILNTWNDSVPDSTHFVCVQSVYIDDEDYLWILDSGTPYLREVLDGSPKLKKINLNSDKVEKTVHFDKDIAPPESYLNDIRIDTKRKFAYITDSRLGAIIIVDLKNGKSRRILEGHNSTKAEDSILVINGNPLKLQVHADGIALNKGRTYLYYKALTANNLYRIPTNLLNDFSTSVKDLENSIELLADVGKSDGMEFDVNNNLYLTSIEDNAIAKLSPNLNLEIVVQSDLIKWPDSFSIAKDGTIYFTTAGIGFRTDTFEIFKIHNPE